jgi:hypothetical protein
MAVDWPWWIRTTINGSKVSMHGVLLVVFPSKINGLPMLLPYAY